MKTSLLLNLSLACCSLLCALLLGEGFLRLRFLAWPFEPAPRRQSHLTGRDAALGWRLPREQGTNSLGLRNRELAAKKPEVFRVLFLGDSLLWIGDTSDGRLHTQVIEENLNRAMPTPHRVEVINAGVPGYTTYQEAEFLKAYGLAMKPDLVVVCFVLNDVYPRYLHRPSREEMFPFDPAARLHRFDGTRFPGRLFARSYLAHEAAYSFEIVRQFFGFAPSFSFQHRDDFYLAWKSHGWAESAKLLEAMQHVLHPTGAPLALVVFPIRDQLEARNLDRDRDYVLSPQRRLRTLCEQRKIPYHDLTEALLAGGGPRLFADHVHLTARGNDLVAVEVTRFLLEDTAFRFAGWTSGL